MTSGTAPPTTQAEELLLGAFGVEGGGGGLTPGMNGTMVNCATTVTTTYSPLPPRSGASAEVFPEYCIVGATGSFQAQGTLTNPEFNGSWGAVLATYKATPPNTSTPTATTTPTSTSTSTATATPTSTGIATSTGTATTTATATRTATPTATATTTSTTTATPSTATPTITGTVAATSTGTPTPTASPSTTATSTGTTTPTVTLTPTAGPFHAFMQPVNPSTGLLAQGSIDNGPCPRPLGNCVEFTITGSFTIAASVGGLPVGFIPVLTEAVANAQGLPAGTRSQTCAPVNAAGVTICGGVVTEAGIFPRLGGPVTIAAPPATVVPTASPTRTTTIVVTGGPPPQPPPPPPLPPPLLLPPPPAPLLPAPPPPAVRPAVSVVPGVPVIPESESGPLLVLGILALGALSVLRARHRS